MTHAGRPAWVKVSGSYHRTLAATPSNSPVTLCGTTYPATRAATLTRVDPAMVACPPCAIAARSLLSGRAESDSPPIEPPRPRTPDEVIQSRLRRSAFNEGHRRRQRVLVDADRRDRNAVGHPDEQFFGAVSAYDIAGGHPGTNRRRW